MNLELDEEEMYMACQICDTHFNVNQLLENSNNEFYCRDCFRRSIVRGRKAHGEGDMVQAHRSDKWGKQLIPNPEIYLDRFLDDPVLDLPELNPSILSLSYSPLRCPKVECSKYISICTLEDHIRHDHTEIPIISMRFDTRCGYQDFHPCDEKFKLPKCISVLKIIDERLLSTEAKPKVPQEDPHLMMAVMCARITDDPDSFDNADDNVILWMASNYQTNFTYSIAVSTVKINSQCKGGVMQKFFGPLLTLNETAEDIYNNGQCLILTYRHCAEMTQHEMHSLILDYVVHA